MTRIFGLLALCATVVACTDVGLDDWSLPSTDTTSSVDAKPEPDPLLLDILFVVDTSASMCQELARLGDALPEFFQGIESFGPVDYRIAVTTTAALGSRSGRFASRVEAHHGFSCHHSRPFPAENDAECNCGAATGWDAATSYLACEERSDCEPNPEQAAGYLACLEGTWIPDDYPWFGAWTLRGWSSSDEHFYANGSVATECRFACSEHLLSGMPTDDDACHQFFGDERLTCAQSDDGLQSGNECWMEPPWEDCPFNLPTVLSSVPGDVEDEIVGTRYAHCFVAAALSESDVSQRQSGFASAWAALSPEGYNALQVCEPGPVESSRDTCVRRFLRPKAKLSIVFISDKDDCSVADGKRIAPADYAYCALFGDEGSGASHLAEATELAEQTDPMPLQPVEDFVAKLRGLREAPDDLFVAVITGDMDGPDEDLSNAERERRVEEYYASRARDIRPDDFHGSYACFGRDGKALLGARYRRLASAFGTKGAFGNICTRAGLDERFRTIGEKLGRAFARSN